jgi:glycosyltransferase involved in cell wall biosynthesis
MVKAIAAQGIFDLVIHVPADAVQSLPMWADGERIEIRFSRLTGTAFEQVYLPIVTAGKLLLNLSGSAPLLKRRQLVTMHDATPFRCPAGFRKWDVVMRYLSYRWLARVADGLSTVSVFSAHELSDVLRVGVDRFMVTGAAADSLTRAVAARPALELKADHYLIVGAGARHKNIGSAVRAIANSGRNVVIVGSSGNRQNIGAAASADDHVVVSDWLTDAELVWLYQHSRAIVFPSTYEGFGLPPLEAQALGCPVVCSDSAALPEVCRDGALYFDPDDPQMLIAQLDRLESEIGLADDLRCKGFANMKHYSWCESAQKILAWCQWHRRNDLLIS